MDEEGSQLPRAGVRVMPFEMDGGANGEETNKVRQRSPAVGSGLDDEDDAQEHDDSEQQQQQQLRSEAAAANSKEEMEVDTTDEILEASVQLADTDADGLVAQMVSTTTPPNTRGDSLNATGKLDDEKEGYTVGGLSSENVFISNSSSHQDVRGTSNSHNLADKEDEHMAEWSNSPSFEGDSLNLHDRDPNYAIQRPDTLGAINLVPQNATAASAKAFQNVSLKAGTRFRASGQGNSALEDTIFDMVQLGRRTRGAGMDQLELNQHHQAVGSDNESDSGDAAEPDSNQCESTEADQYKMNPEADQSDSGRPDYAQEPFGATSQGTRSGARGANGPTRTGRTDEGLQMNDDVDEEEELQGDSRISEEDEQDWERLNDQDLADRAEDDRQYSISDRHAGSSVVNAKGGLPGGWLNEAVVGDSGLVATGASNHMLQLKQHPNSAFSQLNPDASGGYATGGQSGLVVGLDTSVDRKPVQNGTGKKLNVVLQSQEQLMSKPAAVFKPILHEGRMNYVGESGRRAIFPRQYSEGNASESVSDFRFGPAAKHGKTQSENGLRSRTDREDMMIHSPRLLTSNPTFEVGSSESLHGGFLPYRADHLMHGEPNVGFQLGSSALGAFCQQQHQHHHQQQQQQSSALLYHPLPLGCDYEPQVTPQKQTRPSYQLMEDSLELSPIRPPSSQTSQQQQQQPVSHGFIQSPGLASVSDVFRTDRLHCYGYKTSSEHSGEISDIQEVRSHLHSLLTLSDRTIPDKARYDQTNDVDELLTSHPGHIMHDQPSSWNLTGIQEALPLSSKYLLSGASQTKPDVAALAAENRALRDAMEQQRFKRKHCEKQIQQLQNKVLELQQNLAVAVSIDRKKDLTIEQLDKALVKVAEGWHQKEAERQDAVLYLQKENSSLKQTLDSRQQITSRMEMQLNHSLQQFHMEQQRAAQMCLSKDQHISELMSQYQRMQQTLDSERDRWQQRLDDEKRQADQMKEKMQLQLEELKSAHEEEMERWSEKEKETHLKMEKLKETYLKMLEMEKAKLEHQEQACHDLEMVLRATQTEVEQLQLESETMMREKESLKVEMGLMEARHVSSLHQLEAELQSSTERKLSAKLDEVNRKQMESERKLHETYRHQLQELTQQHLEELEQLRDEHQATVSELEETFHQQQKLKDSRIKELEKKVITLEEENRKIETHKLELAGQLQSMMQSHCEEAIRLLRFTQPTSDLVLNSGDSWNGNSKNPNRGAINTIQDNYLSTDPLSSDVVQSSAKETNHLQELPSNNSLNEDVASCSSSFPSDSQQSASPLSDEATGERPAYASACSVSDSAAGQYLQFLASVRSYQPLLADLNASVASVANSFSTLTQTSNGAPSDGTTEAESSCAVARSASSHHVSFQRSPVMSPVQLLQYPQQQQQQQQQEHPTAACLMANRCQVPSNSSDICLLSPVQLNDSTTFGQRQVVFSQQQQQQQHMTAVDQKMKCKPPSSMATNTVPSSSAKRKGERNAPLSSVDYQQSSLFSQILQHDTTNTSDESAIECTEETSKGCVNEEPTDNTNDKLHQQEQRQQQLQHYIRMLLQRSPGVSSQDEHPVSDAVSYGHLSNPHNKQGTYEVRLDNRSNSGGQQRPDARLSSPEQDQQLMNPRKNDRPTSEEPGSHQTLRNAVLVQSNHYNKSAETDLSSRSHPGEVLSQQQLVEISRLLERVKSGGANPAAPSQLTSSPPLPVNDLFGYLKAVCGQGSQGRTKPGDQQSSTGLKKLPATDHHQNDGVLPRNHPSHPINKELIVGTDATAAKQDSTKQCKTNKTESTKPKNASSASKASDKKERVPAPKNSTKHGVWK